MGINREIRYATAGNSSGSSQVFYNNYFADSKEVETSYFAFTKPMFFTYGGTLNYYSQDPYSIFTNLTTPPIRFVFTADTSGLSGDSYFVHKIYKLDYETHKLYSDNQIENSQSLINQSISNQLSTDNNPALRDAPNRSLNNKTGVRMGNNPIVVPEKFFGQPLTSNDLAVIQSKFSEPVLIITASTSGITGSIYDLNLNEYAKQTGRYKVKLFSNKAQYFIDTEIVFNATINKQYSDFYDATIGLKPVSSSWNDNLQIIATNSYNHTIEHGPYAGINVRGNYFSYFTVPDKPVLEYPIMSGQLSTFTPEIRWTNGDKADSFVVQVTYDLNNTGFTGSSVINYPVEKSEENTKTIVNTTKNMDTELATSKNIYNFQFSTKSNKSFLYRVGNSVEIIDVFDVRRNVITFSDYYQATSQPEPIKTYVKIESDSKFVSEIAGYITPPSLDYESAVEEFTLSGVVSGSTVTGATLTLTYPNSSFVNTMTDLTGYYSFSGLETGIYTLTTNYRGYQQDVRTINITGDTSESFKIKLLWGNNVDTWGKMAGENYYT